MACIRWVLPRPVGAVDEERVVGLAGRLGDGVRRGGGELVRLADDEGVEGVALVEGLVDAPVELWAAAAPSPAGGATKKSIWGRCWRSSWTRKMMAVRARPARSRSARSEQRQRASLSFHWTANSSGAATINRPSSREIGLGRDRARSGSMCSGSSALRFVEDPLPGFFGGQLHLGSAGGWELPRARDSTSSIVEKSTLT